MKRQREALSSDARGLSASQAIAFSKVINRMSLFLTGSAGTGKSLVISKVYEYCVSHNLHCAITATTGIAALNVKGRTVHSFFWLRPEDADKSGQDVVNRIRSTKFYKTYKKLLEDLDVLIVDEVSMMSPQLFEQLSDILKLVRHCSSPFGGLQVLLVGDFYQLGPVGTPYLFESAEFKQCIQDTVVLTEIFRQSDPEFAGLLGRMRTATLTQSDHEILQGRVHADVSQFGIRPTELWCTNRDVDRFNTEKLSQIKSPLKTFSAYYGFRAKKGTFSAADIEAHIKKFKTALGPLDIGLKGPLSTEATDVTEATDFTKEAEDYSNVGAQVMLTVNLDAERGLVNGSRGVIIGFGPASQGKIKDRYFLDNFGEDFKMYLNEDYPIVRFIVDSKPLVILLPLVRLARETKEHMVYAWHVPLKLAWATTIHKSQGLSLDCVCVSLDRTVFADGQAYVACSRARTLKGLSLMSFDPKSIKANEKVKAYLASI